MSKVKHESEGNWKPRFSFDEFRAGFAKIPHHGIPCLTVQGMNNIKRRRKFEARGTRISYGGLKTPRDNRDRELRGRWNPPRDFWVAIATRAEYLSLLRRGKRWNFIREFCGEFCLRREACSFSRMMALHGDCWWVSCKATVEGMLKFVETMELEYCIVCIYTGDAFFFKRKKSLTICIYI